MKTQGEIGSLIVFYDIERRDVLVAFTATMVSARNIEMALIISAEPHVKIHRVSLN